jgi:hypothetical protein
MTAARRADDSACDADPSESTRVAAWRARFGDNRPAAERAVASGAAAFEDGMKKRDELDARSARRFAWGMVPPA